LFTPEHLYLRSAAKVFVLERVHAKKEIFNPILATPIFLASSCWSGHIVDSLSGFGQLLKLRALRQQLESLVFPLIARIDRLFLNIPKL
jgi:hypothetical protein